MAIRDTQDSLIFEAPGGALAPGRLRDTQDSLIFEAPGGALAPGRLRDTQDSLIFEYPFISYMFAWDDSSGHAYGFTPLYPPVGKQPLGLWGLEAVRQDSIGSDGIKQSVLDRLDTVTTLTFPSIPLSDLAEWKIFMEYALTGGLFGYRPNATQANSDPTAFSTVRLISTNWDPKFTSFQNFSLEMKVKLVRDM